MAHRQRTRRRVLPNVPTQSREGRSKKHRSSEKGARGRPTTRDCGAGRGCRWGGSGGQVPHLGVPGNLKALGPPGDPRRGGPGTPAVKLRAQLPERQRPERPEPMDGVHPGPPPLHPAPPRPRPGPPGAVRPPPAPRGPAPCPHTADCPPRDRLLPAVGRAPTACSLPARPHRSGWDPRPGRPAVETPERPGGGGGGREGGKEGRREGGREGGKEGRREGGQDAFKTRIHTSISCVGSCFMDNIS